MSKIRPVLIAGFLFGALVFSQCALAEPEDAIDQSVATQTQSGGSQLVDLSHVADQKKVESQPHLFMFQDNSIRWWYGSWFRSPFANSGQNIQMNGFQFTHVDRGNRFGDNLFDVTYIMSNRGDAVSKAFFHNNTTDGARDAYIIYRHDIGLNQLFKTKVFKFGWVDDVQLTAGVDLDSKNNDFGGSRLSPVVGPTFVINPKIAPRAHIRLSTFWTKEWNEEGTDFTSWTTINGSPRPVTWGKPVTYDATYMISASWSFPFKVSKAPLSVEGFGVFSGSKGYTAGSLQPTGKMYYEGTKPETILRPKLMYNFGSLFSEKHNWQLGVGYHYWNNKFGTDHHKNVGCLQHAPFSELAFHW